MKFISKNVNLRVVLTPGIPGERLTGRLANPGKFVKFQNGVAKVDDSEWIKMMKEHPGFNRDFIAVEDESVGDPYTNTRKNTEPEHNVIEIKYGHVGENLNPKSAVSLTAEQKALVIKMASEMAKVMAKDIVREILSEENKGKSVVAGAETLTPNKTFNNADNTGIDIPIARRGRPKKVIIEQPEESITNKGKVSSDSTGENVK